MSYIRTTYTDETELIHSILKLYNDGEGVDLDPCYSKGRFWTGLPEPKLKFDLVPQTSGVVQASCTSLPLENSSINSIMFDPPFVIGIGQSKSGIITNRFSGFKDIHSLKCMYWESLREFDRLLNKNGIVIFKCQDTVTSGKQFFTHLYIITEAYLLGYIVEDLFVLVRERAIMDPKWNGQKHARKTHSYYIVLRKRK